MPDNTLAKSARILSLGLIKPADGGLLLLPGPSLLDQFLGPVTLDFGEDDCASVCKNGGKSARHIFSHSR